MDPRTQGQFVHQVFEAFFRRWQHDGHQAITPDTIDTARTIFAEVVEEFLARLSDTEAALERTRLLGSPAAAGLGEAVFRMEAERPVPVVARLIEHRLNDEFAFETASGPRRMSVNGKADRIDLLADGTFRVIDYKLGWPPNRARALQLPVYGLCAEQSLKGHLGREWTLGEAAYLAFKGPKRVVGLFNSADEKSKVLADAQQRLADTVDAITAGRFPPAIAEHIPRHADPGSNFIAPVERDRVRYLASADHTLVRRQEFALQPNACIDRHARIHAPRVLEV